MLLFAFLMPLMAFATVEELLISDYILKIDNNILLSAKITSKSSVNLNLSGLGLRGIVENVFRDLSHVKNINLANNSLSVLPEFVFSNLTSLEHLSLADNAIEDFEKTFVGLKNLKSLNISNNPMKHLRSGCFFGLTKSTDILFDGRTIRSINQDIFEDPLQLEKNLQEVDIKEVTEHAQDDVARNNAESEARFLLEDIFRDVEKSVLDKSLKVELCIQKGIVRSLEVFRSSLASDCKEIKIKHENPKISLRRLGISGFEKGWYRLQNVSIEFLDLSSNEIVRVVSEMLNDLPADLGHVSFADNQIERLDKGVISNVNLRRLNFDNNFISDIEEGALENTKLTDLFITGNRLTNTKFAFNLPDTLKRMTLNENQINELTAESFSRLNKLEYLSLDQNNISAIKKGSLRGLTSLKILTMAENELKMVEPDTFKDLEALSRLNLYQNNLTNLHKGTFDGLKSMESLNLGFNKLTRITGSPFADLPDTLRELNLDFNLIKSLETGTFVRVPTACLSLRSNKITKIERGTFNLPDLSKLILERNLLELLEVDALDGLERLEYLSLGRNRITKIEKGAMKNLTALRSLDISYNPIERLENGALCGLPKKSGSYVKVLNSPIKIIQGGLFEDL